MADFTYASAERLAYAKRADGTFVNAHSCRASKGGKIAVRAQKNQSALALDAMLWLEYVDSVALNPIIQSPNGTRYRIDATAEGSLITTVVSTLPTLLPIFLSPNGTHYALSVTNEGALLTTVTLAMLILGLETLVVSNSNKIYDVEVLNDGSLVTRAL